ncbi:DUF5412 family protein [Priestia megaterium]
MKKIYKILVGAMLVILLLSYAVWRLIFAPDYLPYVPKGEYMFQSESPNGDYTVKIYQSSGGATTGFAIRGELINNNNSIFNKKKNIYWNYPQETAKVEWIDNDTVNISGHKIDVKTETFDYRDEE